MPAFQPDSTFLSASEDAEDGFGPAPALSDLTLQAFKLRSQNKYAIHPAEAALQYHRASAQGTGASCDGSNSFAKAESVYRAGSQGLRLSEIPQLPQQVRELSRLAGLDRAGRKALREWAENCGRTIDEAVFLHHWKEQGKPGGAEHQVFYDKTTNRWFKRLYHGVNSSTLGEYLVRMRLHAVLFPESAYRLEGFTINPKNKELAPVVSQPHVHVDTSRLPVSKEETDDLMALMGFAPVELLHEGFSTQVTTLICIPLPVFSRMISMTKMLFASQTPANWPS